MKDIYTTIEGHEEVCAAFGNWPSFHDAEILSISLERDEGVPLTGPNLTLKVNIYGSICGPGNTSASMGSITFRFFDLENMALSGFDHQNPILDIIGSSQYDAPSGFAKYDIQIKRVSHFECFFRCGRISVLSVENHR